MANTTPNIITGNITRRVESGNDLVGIRHPPGQTLVRLFDFEKPSPRGRPMPAQIGFHRRGGADEK
jgi:hypothetical protein